MEDPRFIHDCETCVYLGHYKHADLYICNIRPVCIAPSLIARLGDEDSDYCASHPAWCFAEGFKQADWEQEVIDRAKKLGISCDKENYRKEI